MVNRDMRSNKRRSLEQRTHGLGVDIRQTIIVFYCILYNIIYTIMELSLSYIVVDMVG